MDELGHSPFEEWLYFVGRHRARQLLARDITGKGLAQVVTARKPRDDDAFHRRCDGVLNRNRRPLAKVLVDDAGQAQLVRNVAEMDAAGRTKAALLDDLSKLLPPSAAEPKWSLRLPIRNPGRDHSRGRIGTRVRSWRRTQGCEGGGCATQDGLQAPCRLCVFQEMHGRAEDAEVLARVGLEGMGRSWNRSEAAGSSGLLTMLPHPCEGSVVTHFSVVVGRISCIPSEHELVVLLMGDFNIEANRGQDYAGLLLSRLRPRQARTAPDGRGHGRSPRRPPDEGGGCLLVVDPEAFETARDGMRFFGASCASLRARRGRALVRARRLPLGGSGQCGGMGRASGEVARRRVADAGSKVMMLTMSCHFYGTAVLSALGFVAQLEGPPVGPRRAEASVLATLLRAPFRPFPWAAFFNLDKVGGAQLRSAESTKHQERGSVSVRVEAEAQLDAGARPV